MQHIDHFGSFVLAVLVFQLMPGPGTLTILRVTANHGARAGFAAVAGTLGGGLVCMLAAVSGLEAVFRGQPEATRALQFAGSAYLAWMGWRLMSQRTPANCSATGMPAPTLVRHAGQALTVSLTNPKVILFYFALLPLFFRPPVTSVSLMTMITCVSGISLAYQSLLVVAGGSASRWFQSLPAARLTAQRLAGLLFMAFAAKAFVL